MKVEEIEIFTGKPSFPYREIRRLEVKCEATNALMPAPTIDEASGRLRALAAKVGANAIVEVEYNSGISFTSWKSLKATGLAVFRESEEVICEVCAETIKRAATKCRYCGADRSAQASVVPSTSSGEPIPKAAAAATASPPVDPEPLRDNNNPVMIIMLCIGGLFLFSFLIAAA